MSLADSSYPLLNIFWTMFEFFLAQPHSEALPAPPGRKPSPQAQ